MPQYRPIPPIAGCSEWPKWYRAGDDGSVWSRRKRGPVADGVGIWKRLRPALAKRRVGAGTPTVQLTGDGRKGKRISIALDRCICMAFHGPRPDGHVLLHSPDPDKLNCRADNLMWVPRAKPKRAPRPETDDGTPRGTYPRPRTFAHNARLHEKLVLEIRAAHARGETTKQISAKQGLKYSIVRDVIIRRTWKHVYPTNEK